MTGTDWKTTGKQYDCTLSWSCCRQDKTGAGGLSSDPAAQPEPPLLTWMSWLLQHSSSYVLCGRGESGKACRTSDTTSGHTWSTEREQGRPHRCCRSLQTQTAVKHQQKQSANFRMNSRFRALVCHTLLGFLYLVPLVIGSGGVAVKEVITGVTEWLTVT